MLLIVLVPSILPFLYIDLVICLGVVKLLATKTRFIQVSLDELSVSWNGVSKPLFGLFVKSWKVI